MDEAERLAEAARAAYVILRRVPANVGMEALDAADMDPALRDGLADDMLDIAGYIEGLNK